MDAEEMIEKVYRTSMKSLKAPAGFRLTDMLATPNQESEYYLTIYGEGCTGQMSKKTYKYRILLEKL